MAHLDEFIKEVIEKGLAKKAEVTSLIKTIDAENNKIEAEYATIGKLYVEEPDNKAELDKKVEEINASKKTIKESKLKIGELMGITPKCPLSFCPAWFSARTATRL